MRILITGSNGRIGTYLTKILKKNNWVRGLDLKINNETNLFDDFIVSDLLNTELVNDSLYGIDVVVHLAALMSWQPKDNELLFKTNVYGTYNLVAQLNKHKIKKIILASSGEVYPETNPQYIPITEEHPTFPTSTYGITKLMSEKIVKNIRLKSEPLMIVAGHENKKIFIGTAEQDDLARKIPARIVVFEDILDRLPPVVAGNRHSFIEPGEIILESTPHGLAVTEDDKNLLVTIPEMNKVLVIDVERLEIIKELETGKFPHNINIDPDGRFAYVTNSGDATVSIIDIQKMEVVSVVETGNGPQNVQFFNIMGELSNSGPNNQVRKVVSANFNCGG